ncbi:MAG TPA: phage holin family protein [Nitrospiria bacterium]|nr:phage holin family protein [Nitrospiria bacterium]
MTKPDQGEDPRGTGLLDSVQRLAVTLIEIVHTRVDIVATEFEEERERIRELALFGLMALFFAGFGFLLLTLFLIVLFWDTHRLLAVGGFTVLYLGLGGFAAATLRRRLKTRPRLFATTLAELSKDREHLSR